MARNFENASVEPLSVDVTTPAFEAYAKFREDFDSTAPCARRTSLDGNLNGTPGSVKDATVDKMAVVWLAEKYKELGRDVTRADIENGATTKFDKLMSEHAMKQFDAIKHAKFNHEGGFLLIGSREKDVLTGKDIDATLKGIENQRRSMDLVAPLFANNGELYDKLAGVHNGQKSLNYWDLKDARKADDKARSKGDSIYTAEERQVIDTLYKKWGSADMRRVENRGPGDDMGCDGVLTYRSAARGAGFEYAQDMDITLNGSTFVAAQVRDVCEGEARNSEVLSEAIRMTREGRRQIEANSQHVVQPGEGFDRIARHALTRENGQTPSEAEVVQFSSDIATRNGYSRNDDVTVRAIQPNQVLELHGSDWKTLKHLDNVIKVQEYLDQNLDNDLLGQTLESNR